MPRGDVRPRHSIRNCTVGAARRCRPGERLGQQRPAVRDVRRGTRYALSGPSRRPCIRALALARCCGADWGHRPSAATLIAGTRPTTMTEAELAAAYTHLCKTLTDLAAGHAPVFLARF